ncbi:MAG: hypothetical protein ACYSRR_07645 [Planctomycetota bacterium]
MAIVTALAGIVLIIVSLHFKVDENIDNGTLTGLGIMLLSATAWILAIAALIVETFFDYGYTKSRKLPLVIIILIFPFVFMLGIGMLSSCIYKYRRMTCIPLHNLELLNKALVAYANDNNGRLPRSDQWCDDLLRYDRKLDKSNFKHPYPEEFSFANDCHFAFNRNLSNMRLADIPEDVVLIFEADGNWNLNGTGELLIKRDENNKSTPMVFVNGLIREYWFYKNAIRKIGPDRKSVYEKPRWQP